MDNRYYFNFENSQTAILDKTETQHLVKVRRASVGDKITGFCGDGFDYNLQIKEINKWVICDIIDKKPNVASCVTPITVFLATLKSDALNETVDALTQLNVKNIVVFDAKHSVASVDEDKIEKLKAKSIQACKQCERADFVGISSMKFKQVLSELNNYDIVLFAYEDSKNKFNADLKQYKGKRIAIIVGCEGGFDKTEAEQFGNIASTVSLGKTILRAPVACVSIVSAVMSGLGEWER